MVTATGIRSLGSSQRRIYKRNIQLQLQRILCRAFGVHVVAHETGHYATAHAKALNVRHYLVFLCFGHLERLGAFVIADKLVPFGQ